MVQGHSADHGLLPPIKPVLTGWDVDQFIYVSWKTTYIHRRIGIWTFNVVKGQTGKPLLSSWLRSKTGAHAGDNVDSKYAFINWHFPSDWHARSHETQPGEWAVGMDTAATLSCSHLYAQKVLCRWSPSPVSQTAFGTPAQIGRDNTLSKFVHPGPAWRPCRMISVSDTAA